MPSLPHLGYHLSDGTVSLRLGAERDIPEILIAYQDDPELHLRLGEERPPSGAELGRRCEQAESRRLSGWGVTLTILREGSDECIGEVRVHTIDWIHARVELGLWLAPGVRGGGLAPRALRLAAEWLLQRCGIERVGVLTEPANDPMLGAARAAGFVREGTLRGYTRERGERIDCVALSLLPGDLR